MAKFDFKNVTVFGWDFLRETSISKNPKTLPMPLNFIEDLHMTHRGEFGKFLICKFCSLEGLKVTLCPEKNKQPYDWLINDHRVAVKFAFEGKEGKWTFNQIRYPNAYDYLCCLGIFPTPKGNIDGKCFVFNKREIDDWIDQKIFPFQHPGKETWNWTISSKVIPKHYSGKATIDELISRLSK